MKVSYCILSISILLLSLGTVAQQTPAPPKFTHADTLRGSITPERAWWNVLRYEVAVKPDYNSKTISGSNEIRYQVVKASKGAAMQIDLQEPLEIASVLLDAKTSLSFTRDGNAWFIKMPEQQKSTEHTILIQYGGKVHEATRPPWDGGWIWTKDSLGRPWMSVACQGTGASVWYPCKDHQSDEPDKGASLTMTVPDTLVAIGNGRLISKKENGDGTITWKYGVTNPISNYCIIPYIGKYSNFKELYAGEKGNLDLNYWVLDYNLEKARSYMPPEVHNMLKAFEFWFGPYPFYEDGYQLIETSHPGMEHQSAVAYGNYFKPGYRGRDVSGTGLGMKFDFIIIHESGHEWYGNNITTKDLADMWIHEGFTNYSETLFVDYLFGKDAANTYNAGSRRGIKNDRPIVPPYNVNAEGSGDMYPKASNMIHAIRHGLDNDTLFRQILRGMNKTFYHQTVTGKQIEEYISSKAKFNYSKVYDQYVTTVQIPSFEYYFTADKKKVFYRYTNCINGFNMPLTLKNNSTKIRIVPGTEWKSQELTATTAGLFDKTAIEFMYYLKVIPTESK
jgi:aminopeptidase N